MKLLRLKLGKSFRSLAEGFEVQFLREQDYDRCFDFHPYCLAGLNGSGKSNLLEVLAAIFYHLDCIYLDPDSRPVGFMTDDENNFNLPGFNPRLCDPDAFEVEYLFSTPNLSKIAPVFQSPDGKPVYRIRIIKQEQERPTISVVTASTAEVLNEVALDPSDVRNILPAYVLGCSSGHNEVLSLPFFKSRFITFDEYCDKLVKRVNYPDRPESRLIYLDDQFSQVILLCHYLFPSKAATKVFEDKVQLKGFRCFRLIIRRFKKIELEQAKRRVATSQPQETTTTELTESLSHIIAKLICCATTHYEQPRTDESEDAVDLYLDYWLDDETQKAFSHHFRDAAGGTPEEQKAASALNLFHAFQILLTLNVYKIDFETKRELYESDSLYVNETVPTPASHERIARFKDSRLLKINVTEEIYLKNLSDGEHQLLHTIGLCLLFRHKPALFLLDEPETHLNPGWRASYISTLRTALEADPSTTKVMREVLLTTHSPFIISDCQQENVLIFKKDAKNKITCERPENFQTFGASANAITIKIFGQTETIGNYAKLTLDHLQLRLEADEDPKRLIQEANDLLGDSVEKLLFINYALNRTKKT